MPIQHTQLQIQGMSCQACANRIEKVLNKQEFIQSANVNFASETAQIQFDDTQINLNDLIHLIEKTGFQAALIDAPSHSPTARHPWQLIILLLLASPFMLGMTGMLLGSTILMPPIWLQILLASIVQSYFAYPFYRSAIASLRSGTANMDVLVSIGTLAIYLYSIGLCYTHQTHHVYFEASVMIISFVTLGKHLETTTKHNSLNALNSLLTLVPKQVSVYQQQQWIEKPLSTIQIGDIIRCRHGERIAADGIVTAGEGWIDESHLTGESQPIYKNIGSKVLAGSILSGSLEYQATHLGKDTLLGDMTTALAEAQGSKAPIARLADQIASIFIPIILIIALLTFILTYLFSHNLNQAIVHSVSILVVACPCALGLATPAAIMAGMGLAIQQGIWFKNAAALEQAGKIDTIVLDKTGTLTQGKPNIIDIWLAPNHTESELYSIAASIEQHSTHPLAQTIVQAAQAYPPSPHRIQDIQTHAGEGISAKIDNLGQIKIGKLSFCNFRLPETWLKHHLQWQTASIVGVSLNQQAIGAFALSDELKPDSISTLQKLQQQGFNLYLLSGDQPAIVTHIATALNIPLDHAHGSQSPRQKTEFIQQLQKQGKIVAMVGDGINDAAALATANMGFTVKNSTHIAEQSADALLIHPSLTQLANGLHIAKATVRTIKQNLFFAFIYNLLGIPLAAFGLLTPILAGAMMTMSSLSVLINALRLKKLNI